MAAAITMLSASSLKQDARRQSLQKLSNFTAVAASAGVKKSSVCLQTKFQLVRCSASVVQCVPQWTVCISDDCMPLAAHNCT